MVILKNTYQRIFDNKAKIIEYTPSLVKSNFIGKRIFDILFSIIGIAIASPFCIVLALIIKIIDGGSALFIQKRIGYNGDEFMIYKFKSMNDNKVTKFGSFIRKYRIDEIPQLINVFKGNMSLIGPRPEITEKHNYYMEIIPAISKRLSVKPGITGYAQINQTYEESVDNINTKLYYDIYYIRNKSFKMELFIIYNTIKTVLRGTGG